MPVRIDGAQAAHIAIRRKTSWLAAVSDMDVWALTAILALEKEAEEKKSEFSNRKAVGAIRQTGRYCLQATPSPAHSLPARRRSLSACPSPACAQGPSRGPVS